MAGSTHYETLGVDADATTEEIRSGYLDQAKELHPDRVLGLAPDPEVHGDQAEVDLLVRRAMQEVNAAWEVLRNPTARAEYDADLGLSSDGGDATDDHASQCDCPPGDGCGYVHAPWDISNGRGEMPQSIERVDRDPDRVGLWMSMAVIGLVLATALTALVVVNVQGRGSGTSFGHGRPLRGSQVVGVTPARGNATESTANLVEGSCVVLASIDGRVTTLASGCSLHGAFQISAIVPTGTPCRNASAVVDIESDRTRLCLITP